MIIQITWNEGRTVEQKKALYKAIADRLAESLSLRREDVFISLIEVKRENWSFGDGIAQYATESRAHATPQVLRQSAESLANSIAPARSVLLDVEVHVVGVERV